MFLVACVETDIDESLVKDIALSSGLVSPADTTAKSLGELAGHPTGIPEHVSVGSRRAHMHILAAIPGCLTDRAYSSCFSW